MTFMGHTLTAWYIRHTPVASLHTLGDYFVLAGGKLLAHRTTVGDHRAEGRVAT